MWGFKKKEEKGGWNKERYAYLLENIDEVVLVVDKLGRLIYINKKGEEGAGYNKKELVGKPITRLLTRESVRPVRLKLAQEFAGHPQEWSGISIRCKNGETDHLRLARRACPILQHNRVIGLSLNAHDVTSEKQVAKALNRSEECFRELVENAPIGICYNDLKGKFIYSNRKVEEIIGCHHGELFGKSFLNLEVLTKQHRAKVAKLLTLNKLGKTAGPDELSLVRRDGTVREIEICTRLIVVDGVNIVMGIVEDMTERKGIERALISQNRELERINRLLVGRETKMIELKRQITRLEVELGR